MTVIDKLIFNVSRIGEIPRGKRINTSKEFITVEEDSMIQGIKRWIQADSRDKTIAYIVKEVQTAVLIVSLTSESQFLFANTNDKEFVATHMSVTYNKRIETLKKFRQALEGSVIGIENICHTYEQDSVVSGNLIPLITEISVCVTEINKLLDVLHENDDYIDPRK